MQGEERAGRRRFRRHLTTIVASVVVPAALLAADAGWTMATNPERATEVRHISDGFADADTFQADTATVFLNGLGLDISARQAQALTTSVGSYGRVLALEYASVFDADEAAHRLHDALLTGEGVPDRVRLTVVASSMGDVRGLEIIASLRQHHRDITVVGFIVNTGPGPEKRLRVKGGQAVQALLDQSCAVVAPGQVTLGLLEVFNQAQQGRIHTTDDLVAAYGSGTAYRGRVVVNQLCSLTRPPAVNEPPYIPFKAYLTTGDPADDVIVDGERAYHDWRRLLPGMELRTVEGATHDNLSYRPDLFNPLFADDLMPRIAATRPVDRTPGHHTSDRTVARPA